MDVTKSGLHVVGGTEKVEAALTKDEDGNGAKPPEWVLELSQMDFTNEQIYRFNLVSNLVALRIAVENLVDELRKAPVQRVMNMSIPPELEIQAREQLQKMLGGKRP